MLNGRALVGLLVLCASLVACKSEDPARAIDMEVKAAVEHIQNELSTPLPTGPRAPGARSTRDLVIEARRRNTEECMWLTHLDGVTTVVRDATLRSTYKRLCTHDVQLSMLRQLADAAEVARKAAPDGERLADCDATELFIATDELASYKTADAESAALEARFTAACAPSPAASASSSGSGSAAP